MSIKRIPHPLGNTMGRFQCQAFTRDEIIEIHYDSATREYRIRPTRVGLTYLRADAGLGYNQKLIRAKQEAVECFETDKVAAFDTARAMFAEFDAKPIIWEDAK